MEQKCWPTETEVLGAEVRQVCLAVELLVVALAKQPQFNRSAFFHDLMCGAQETGEQWNLTSELLAAVAQRILPEAVSSHSSSPKSQ